MKVNQLIELLKRFPPDSEVRLSFTMPGRVIETHERIWVADYGGGPQIGAAQDFRGFHVFVGCGLDQFVREIPARMELDLGEYASPEVAAQVRDFYIVHTGIDEPLTHPDFDYENWIPPRMNSGEYNDKIARILKEKLLSE